MPVELSRTALTVVAVGGFESNSGKTTLLCELLRAFPGWEAIKVTRGHYRSCGRDPQACCVSPLLGDAPLVRTGRAETYAPGKDTGRYWDAGASNVHWVVATDRQVERGITDALGRVASRGVVIEGNSFSQFVDVDFFVMVASHGARMKPTARRALSKADALYLPDPADGDYESARREVGELLGRQESFRGSELPLYTSASFAELIESINERHARREARAEELRGVAALNQL
jgi:molybdopterin-guanine dinucleotide biosynthesis protein